MKISFYDMRRMKDKILSDMYLVSENKFKKRRTEIAKNNRSYYMAKIQPILDQLPKEMITCHKRYELQVHYKPQANDTEFILQEIWTYESDVPLPNPHNLQAMLYGSASPAVNTILDPRLQKEAAVLCNDILALKTERTQLETYLNETTDKYSGSLQLRKIWPESLQKYLPIEPKRVPRGKSAPKAITVDPAVPTFIPSRMTTNLLEGK